MSLFGLSGKYIGIDLGTSTIMIVLQDKGIIKSEPSIVAVENSSNSVIALGAEAKEMLGKTPEDIEALMPMKQGCIANLKATEMIISRLIKELQEKENIGNPKVVINVHIGMTEVEKRAVVQLLKDLGAKEIYFVEETFSSAVGANLDIDSAEASMMVNIGGGTTEVAVIALGKIAACNYIKIAGDDLDNDIIEYIKKNMLVVIGKNAAEAIKVELASVYPLINKFYEVTGCDLKTGLPKKVKIDAFQVHDAIKNSIEKVIEMIRETLDRTPPELLNDIQSKGLVISGGGAYIKEIDKFISRSLRLNARIAENPEKCTALGIYKILNDSFKLNELKNKRRF